MQSVKPSGALDGRALPRHGEHQKQGIETRIAKALADVSPGSDKQPFFPVRDGGELAITSRRTFGFMPMTCP
jgi:hypothetical protein